jgi:hypothetical protein
MSQAKGSRQKKKADNHFTSTIHTLPATVTVAVVAVVWNAKLAMVSVP